MKDVYRHRLCYRCYYYLFSSSEHNITNISKKKYKICCIYKMQNIRICIFQLLLKIARNIFLNFFSKKNKTRKKKIETWL